jgi:DNA repair exonuclease SbcCD ATPase subunit
VGLREPPPQPAKNASRNEKDRKRRADGRLRHQLDLANKQAEIDHLKGSLTGVLGQMANFEGVAEVIRDYQKPVQPWDDDEPVDLVYCRGCGGRGIRAEMEIAQLTAICRKSDCGPLENELVRLRAQIATLEERKTGDSEAKAEEEMKFASQADAEGELARVRAELEEEKLKNAELDSKNDDLDSKVEHLEIEILVIKSKLASPPSPPPCEDCVVHE